MHSLRSYLYLQHTTQHNTQSERRKKKKERKSSFKYCIETESEKKKSENKSEYDTVFQGILSHYHHMNAATLKVKMTHDDVMLRES